MELEIGGSMLSFETGELAKQADGSVVVRYGDTVVIATACHREGPVPGDFMPLTVDYKEYTYAGGRIPGGFFKREGRPTEKEILTCRLIDRPLRPSFTPGYRQETQVIGFVLSADGENDPDILAINGASAALSISELPFPNPIGAVRIGYLDGEFLVNPTNSQRDLSELDLVVAGTDDAIVMVEAGAREVSESLVLDALEKAHEEIKRIVEVQKALRAAVAPSKLEVVHMSKYTPEIFDAITEKWGAKLSEAMQVKGKFEQRASVDRLKSEALAEVPEDDADLVAAHKAALGDLETKIFRELAAKKKVRVDGRKPDEIRDITISTAVLPRTHGSVVFTRGETQALVTVTLGTPQEAQKIEDFEGETFQRFMLHYNFPPFSVGEAKFLRGPARREIGHGNLARRALMPVLPSESEFAYTMRVVSDILESNGSSSMATVCGGSLAMMDAGIPIRSAVAGVAMGLVKEGDDHVVLSDIAGIEDHEGDMDFKVAGTAEGITALQMDIKIAGVSREVMAQALEQARAGRLHILGKMNEAIAAPRQALSTFAPRLYTINVPKDKIRDIIGPGGKMIRSIVEQTGCKIEVEDDGKVIIASSDEAGANMAIEIIRGLTASAEIGKRYTGTVRRVEAYGAFIEILPGQDGLLHVSEIDHGRVKSVTDYMDLGDTVEVECVDIDSDTGKIRLSRKPLLPPPTEEQIEAEKKARESRESRGGDRGGDRGDRGGRGGDRGPRRGSGGGGRR
jgi:polyribonucleotide nucleotidyltransferase